MTKKYRIVESYRHKETHLEADYSNPGYIIQYLEKHKSVDSEYEYWSDFYPVNFRTRERAIEELEKYKKRIELENKPEEVVYEMEF